MLDWISTARKQPPNGLIVETKIHDERGCRNEQKLMRRGRLWYIPDGSMYVYYTPTHWRLMICVDAFYDSNIEDSVRAANLLTTIERKGETADAKAARMEGGIAFEAETR